MCIYVYISYICIFKYSLHCIFRTKMPLTSAEKMRRYHQRIREDAARHEMYKQRERDRWTERKNLGKTPTIESKTEKGKRITRS